MTTNRVIDLFSDTTTRPTEGMRRAMAAAEVGDEQRREDPTTRKLEERVAELFGKEAAVFLPSGTMCNQISLLVHCRPGDEIIGAAICHILNYEAAGGAALAGVQNWSIACAKGIFTGADVEAAVRDTGLPHHPRSRLVTIEQTVNLGGGAIWPLAAIDDVASAARRHGLCVHMDGARILNAVVASGVAARKMAAPCDSVWLALSKGLGCPVGAVLAGSKDFISEAWRWKHRLGGAMRQSGVLAAAGLYALEHHVERLAEDHANAKRLGELAGDIKGVVLVYPEIETNIVFMDIGGTGWRSQDVSSELSKRCVQMGASHGGRLRAVTHLDVARADVEAAMLTLDGVLRRHM